MEACGFGEIDRGVGEDGVCDVADEALGRVNIVAVGLSVVCWDGCSWLSLECMDCIDSGVRR